MDRFNKIEITEGQLWDFTYKEICNVCKISKGQLAMSKEYKGFKRRFNHYIKNLTKPTEENWKLNLCPKCNQMTNHKDGKCLKCKLREGKE